MSDFTDELERWLLKYESGKNWHSKLPSPDTRRIFSRHLEKYCQAVNQNPDQLIALKIEGLKSVATSEEWKAERQLETYLRNSDLTPSAKAMAKNAMISFYKHNWRNLNSNVASDIEAPEPKKRTPSISDIVALDENMTCKRDKAMVWFFASTSCRLGTALKLYWRDFKPTNDLEVPYFLEIEAKRLKGSGIGKYKGLKQITFIHKLAWQKLVEYREEAQRRGYELRDDSPLFIGYRNEGKPIVLDSSTIERIFDESSLSAWKDLEVKKFSPHDTRDFLQSSLESANINLNLISPMLSHKTKNKVDGHYSNHLATELLEKYKSALPYLLPETVAKVKANLDSTKAEYEKKLDNQNAKLSELGDYISEIDHALIDLKKKHPSLTDEDLKILKESTNSAISTLNQKMTLVLEFLSKKYPEMKKD